LKKLAKISVNNIMDTETLVAYFLLFCPVALVIGVLVWCIWRDKK
jgi:hypothetical protein